MPIDAGLLVTPAHWRREFCASLRPRRARVRPALHALAGAAGPGGIVSDAARLTHGVRTVALVIILLQAGRATAIQQVCRVIAPPGLLHRSVYRKRPRLSQPVADAPPVAFENASLPGLRSLTLRADDGNGFAVTVASALLRLERMGRQDLQRRLVAVARLGWRRQRFAGFAPSFPCLGRRR